jgi:ribosome maturation factor RimP
VRFITVEDCEKVTRQLQFALNVDGVKYARLEVSSPGIDRPLCGEKDFERFVGEVVDVTLKEPIGAAAARNAGCEKIAVNRKKFRGILEAAPAQAGELPGQRWRIVWSNALRASKPGQRIGKKRAPEPMLELGFTLDELGEARLAPVVDFKGRSRKSGDVPQADKG